MTKLITQFVRSYLHRPSAAPFQPFVNPMGGWGLLIVAGLVTGWGFDARAQAAAPLSIAACRYDMVASGRVVKILDGRSFLLDDGREVRLAAIEVPAGTDDASSRAGAARDAAAALGTVLAG